MTRRFCGVYDTEWSSESVQRLLVGIVAVKRARSHRYLEAVVSGSVIVAGARTPMGRLLGSLKDFSGAQLGGFAIKGALARAGVAPEQVRYVIMGQVLAAGAGQIPARQAAVNAGIPMSVPALSINKVCLSGLDATSSWPVARSR
jgi:hypothetical protein